MEALIHRDCLNFYKVSRDVYMYNDRNDRAILKAFMQRDTS